VIPWSHRLPEFVHKFPSYGANLMQVADVALRSSDPRLVIDIGANVGDSALALRHHNGAAVLAVEGDPYWLDYLNRNVVADADVVVEPSLIVSRELLEQSLSPRRLGGTTTFVAAAADSASTGCRSITAEELVRRHPRFAAAGLVKSDTDGFDTRIVPLLAAALQPAHPVLFFEYDSAISRTAGDPRPEDVWSRLAALGYATIAVWDNIGKPLGDTTVADMAREPEVFDALMRENPYAYWDVAVVHEDSPSVAEGIRSLVGDRRLASG
jgi:FkbM family methyltransferase